MSYTPKTPIQTQEPTLPTVKDLSGYDEGTVLPSGEIIKGSYDGHGTLVGWRKEPAGSTSDGFNAIMVRV